MNAKEDNLLGGGPTRPARPRRVAAVTIVDRFDPKWTKRFRTRLACQAWLMEGLAGTDGAEREHYADMLVELAGGAKILHYN